MDETRTNDYTDDIQKAKDQIAYLKVVLASLEGRERGIIKVEKGIQYNKTKDTYVVSVGFPYDKRKLITFATLDEARKYYQALIEETTTHKILNMQKLARKRENELVAKEIYPINLLNAIQKISNQTDEIERSILIDDTLDELLSKLSPREQKAIELYYQNQLILDECGKELDISRERARQIIQKALRKLNYHARYSETEKTKEIERADEERKFQALLEQRERFIEIAREQGITQEIADEFEYLPNLNADINVLDLSVRSWRCLKRARIHTIQDLINKEKELKQDGWKLEEWLMKLRNLGVKSLNEILTKYREYMMRFEICKSEQE